MKPEHHPSGGAVASWLLRLGIGLLVVSGASALDIQEIPQGSTPATASGESASTIPMQQLESLIAPIALYPDDLLAQTLVASTYPLEIVQLQQWLEKHKDLEGQELLDAVAEQDWDPSIQSMAAVPEVVERLANDIQWTTELGNAFLAQQGDVMEAAQRMRRKAQNKGALESNEQQQVETRVVEKDTVIVVVSSDPEVIYVPTYNPTVVYGPPLYPYPPIYYPYYPPGGPFISFSIGFMWGSAWGGSCCGCGWGGNDIYINNENNFNRVSHREGDRGERGDRAGERGDRQTWQHDSKHRGAAPYGDRATAERYGGQTRSDRAAATDRARAAAGDRSGRGSAGVSDRAGQGGPGASDRAGREGRSRQERAPSASDRGGASQRGGDKIGNRSIPERGSRNDSGFSSGSRRYNGSSARANSSRGSRSRGGMPRGGGRRR